MVEHRRKKLEHIISYRRHFLRLTPQLLESYNKVFFVKAINAKRFFIPLYLNVNLLEESPHWPLGHNAIIVVIQLVTKRP